MDFVETSSILANNLGAYSFKSDLSPLLAVVYHNINLKSTAPNYALSDYCLNSYRNGDSNPIVPHCKIEELIKLKLNSLSRKNCYREIVELFEKFINPSLNKADKLYRSWIGILLVFIDYIDFESMKENFKVINSKTDLLNKILSKSLDYWKYETDDFYDFLVKFNVPVTKDNLFKYAISVDTFMPMLNFYNKKIPVDVFARLINNNRGNRIMDFSNQLVIARKLDLQMKLASKKRCLPPVAKAIKSANFIAAANMIAHGGLIRYKSNPNIEMIKLSATETKWANQIRLAVLSPVFNELLQRSDSSVLPRDVLNLVFMYENGNSIRDFDPVLFGLICNYTKELNKLNLQIAYNVSLNIYASLKTLVENKELINNFKPTNDLNILVNELFPAYKNSLKQANISSTKNKAMIVLDKIKPLLRRRLAHCFSATFSKKVLRKKNG